jgi:hypothetical protein
VIEEFVTRPDLNIREAAEETLHCRLADLKPDTCDENTRSVEAVLATESQATSVDSRTGKGILQVWRMDGAEFGGSVPLMDNHNRGSVRNILGSVTAIRRTPEGQLVGRISVSEAEPNVWTKVREGHIRAVSGGVKPLEFETVRAGQFRHIGGASYTAPANQDMQVVTKWQLREVSLTPVGSDPAAKIRFGEGSSMGDNARKFLEGIGLPATATAEEAKHFYDSLPEVTRKLADENVGLERADEGDEGGEATRSDGEGVERAAKKIAKAVKKAAKVAAETETDADKIRSEAAIAERKRVKDLTRLGTGLPEEVVRKAIDDGLSVEAASVAFLEAHRNRTPPAQPAIHSRSHDADCTAATLGLGLALRHCDGEQLLKLNAQYAPSDGQGGPGSEYVLRKTYGDESHRKNMERLLNQADEYRSMSLVDIGREALRLDGKPVNLRTSAAEVFRSAVSGSALSNIFTTNVNAQFLTGYTDFTDSTRGWCSEADVNNFLTQERDTMGKFGSLQKVVKGRPAEHLDTSDSKESYKIARYGGQFVVDEQDFINDRFGSLETESPKDMGLTAAQLRPNLVYGILLANAALDVDAVALFDATTHKNYASGSGTALAAASLQTAIAAMAKQRINKRALNIRPRFLIIPQDLWATARILLTSAQRIVSTSDGGTANPLLDVGITIVQDDRIGAAGVIDPTGPTARVGVATNWFLAARPGEEGAKTIEVGYLRGTGRAPAIRSFVLDQGQWGMGWDIKMDIGGKALDFRGFYKSLGDA